MHHLNENVIIYDNGWNFKQWSTIINYHERLSGLNSKLYRYQRQTYPTTKQIQTFAVF